MFSLGASLIAFLTILRSLSYQGLEVLLFFLYKVLLQKFLMVVERAVVKW